MILVMNDLQARLIKISTDLYNHNFKTMERKRFSAMQSLKRLSAMQCHGFFSMI